MTGTLSRCMGALLAGGCTLLAGLSDAWAAESMTKTSQQKPIVIIGASYAQGWPVTVLDGMTVINKGAGGEQTYELLARFDRDVIAAKPRAVLIWGFINDIFRSKPEELNEKLVRSRDNIRNMVDKARSQGIAVILATEVTLPASTGWAAWLGKLRGKQSYREQINERVIEVNRWIRALAAEKKLVLLDFEKALAGLDGMRKPEYTTEDGTHLSSQAYEALSRYTEGRKLLN